jgi:tetratricopeptide (TPR) repeat protein
MSIPLFKKAVKYYKKALDITPYNSADLAYLGQAQCRLGLFPRGLASLEKSLRLNPNDKMTHFNLARYLLEANHGDAAQKETVVSHLRKSIEIDPNFNDGRKLLERVINSSG